ncbi:hypothetical protein [Flavobacterium sp.]|uniref:hypothetical protein n=1 Tax=Flavobacterium sp. TaxID=239 RepID=UPI002B4B7C55|nr:hypothetical protein [Flavobacterium sp.]HLP64308.1 hypothetical protein [Flavobacterium sp.]
MKFKVVVLCFLFSMSVFSQDEVQKVEPEWDESIAFHGGFGVQKSLFAELGISKFSLMEVGYFPISKSMYSSIEFSPTIQPQEENHIYGWKVGYEFSLLFVSAALEAKCQTDFKNNDFVITPKLGLGAFGVVTFYYGFNISTQNKPFSRIGNHQFSIVCNLNKKILSM